MSDFRLPARTPWAAAALQVALQANLPSWSHCLCARACLAVSPLVNEDNGLCAPAAVTRHYLCPSQFNMGESACFAGGLARGPRPTPCYSPPPVLRERLQKLVTREIILWPRLLLNLSQPALKWSTSTLSGVPAPFVKLAAH